LWRGIQKNRRWQISSNGGWTPGSTAISDFKWCDLIRKALPGKTQHPETVNFDEPPSKLLQRLYKEKIKRTYKKVTHGKALFDRLDPAIAYKKCPYLRELFDEMLKIAREAGL